MAKTLKEGQGKVHTATRKSEKGTSSRELLAECSVDFVFLQKAICLFICMSAGKLVPELTFI